MFARVFTSLRSMKWPLPLLVTVLGLFYASPLLHGRSLSDAAALKAKELKAGCIVTGELADGKSQFALAGTAPDGGKGVPPEKLLFEIGSITKVFTGLLLAQAVVEKKVNLQTTVAEVLGKDVSFADPRVGAITLEQLSTHTSGLPRLPSNAAAGMVEGDPYANYDEKLLLAYLQGATLEGKAPYTLSYSNVGAGLLGYLLGRSYGTSWEALVMEKICLPLGLKDTVVDPRPGQVIAPPYSADKPAKPWHLAAVSGAGALRSTAADMLKFGQALLRPEKTPLREALALALVPHAEAPGDGGHIGLGIFISRIAGEKMLHHDGGTGGYRSALQVIPGRNLVRVALINNATLGGSVVLAATADTPAKPAAKPKEIPLTAAKLAEYPGVYELDRDSRFTVLQEDGALWVRLTGQAFLRVVPMAEDRFFYKAVAAELAFNRPDKAGAVHSLTLFQNGRELTARRTGDAPKITLRSAKELQPFAGEYALMGMKKLWVKVRGNTLYAQLEGQEEAPVFETAVDRFEFDVVQAALVFTRDDAKSITGLVLQQNGLSLPAPRAKTPVPSGAEKK